MGTFAKFSVLGVTLLALMGCGRGNRAAKVDQGVFGSYVDKFEEAGRRVGLDIRGTGHTVPIEFGEVSDEDAYGECRWHLIHGNRVIINEDRWKALDELSRESLVFHEMGHCALGRRHDDSDVIVKRSDGENEHEYPKSLMNSILVSGRTFEVHREYYEKELFGK